MDALMFQAEVRRIEKLLYRVAWSYMGNNADVEDAVQDALIRAWEKRDTLRDLKQFRPWMARILTKNAKNGASSPWRMPPHRKWNRRNRIRRCWRRWGS